MGRLVARGKYLFDGERKFYARGVSYGPFPENSRGERYPEPERVAADFVLMNQMGANVVRCYVPPPPWLLEEAIRHNLRLMVGIPWPFHMAFLDSREMAAGIRTSIRTGVESLRQYGDAILAYSLGNEVRSDIARWHGPRAVSNFLRELYDIGKQADPAGLFTYSNYPTTEYLDLSFLDFVCFNVYLHREQDYRRYLTHLMAATGERPLMLSETGMDTIREGEEHQAELLTWQARAAFELGLSGFIVFAFTDEWHTGGVEIADWAFGLVKKIAHRSARSRRSARSFAANFLRHSRVTPKTSVIVPAYNSAATIGACLGSLKGLRYPDYETIVVDDGSTDSTAEIVEASQTRLIRGEHRGLGRRAMRGIEAAAANWSRSSIPTRAPMRTGSTTSSKPSRGAGGGRGRSRTLRRIVNAAFALSPRREFLARCAAAATSSRSYADATWRSQSRAGEVGGFDPSFTRGGRRRRSLVAARRTAGKKAHAAGRCARRGRHSRAPRDLARVPPPAARLWRRRRPPLQKVSTSYTERAGFMAAPRGCRRCWAARASTRRLRARAVPDASTPAPNFAVAADCRRHSNGSRSSVILASLAR